MVCAKKPVIVQTPKHHRLYVDTKEEILRKRALQFAPPPSPRSYLSRPLMMYFWRKRDKQVPYKGQERSYGGQWAKKLL